MKRENKIESIVSDLDKNDIEVILSFEYHIEDERILANVL